MTLRTHAAFLLAAVVLAPPAVAAERIVDIPGKSFAPSDLTILAGDTVTWRNEDSVGHDVAADDDLFDSGGLSPGLSFSFTFTEEGTYAYQCTIHRFMTGVVRVFGLALSGPERPVPSGGAVVLRGLAPAGAAVTIERLGPGGSFRPVATVGAAEDGTFRAVVRPGRPARYRATVGTRASEVVGVLVGARLRLSVMPGSGRHVLRVVAAPSQAGAGVVLERYVRERFAWEPLQAGRLDRRSRATFTVAPGGVVHLRAVIPRGVRGFGTTTSRTLVLRPLPA